MHIADGILPVGAAAAADALALGTVSVLSRKIKAAEIPETGLMASALFLASLLHFPVAGTSVHLGLYGLAGVLLGPRSVPAVFVALLFQSLLFQHGGLVALGVNTVNMGLGALAAWLLWRAPGRAGAPRAFAAGFAGILVPAALMILEFRLIGYGRRILFLALVYVAVAALEGVLTAAAVAFLRKTEPSLLETRP
ncbi:MAG TPA: CbiM family transporter [Candidatus Aminicenantes bacterium]|nr:CbiM family transporter [Candidatus Aminicenantes bacterium]